MRKTSQDGGDATSITSGFENEVKRQSIGLIKVKRNSIKKKVQTFSCESDDAAIEPLLQKDKDKEKEIANRSAKFLLSKSKTEFSSDKGSVKDKIISGTSELPALTENVTLSNGIRDKQPSITTIHNQMNTNVFNDIKNGIPKNHILVEIDGSNQSNSYSPSPLIFTVAKIHTDNKTKQMEPIQVTPVPISSTIENKMVKVETVKDKQLPKNPVNVEVLSAISKDISKIKDTEKDQTKVSTSNSQINAVKHFQENSLNINLRSQSSTDKEHVERLTTNDTKLPKTIYGISDLEKKANQPHKSSLKTELSIQKSSLQKSKETVLVKDRFDSIGTLNLQKEDKTAGNGDITVPSSKPDMNSSSISQKLSKSPVDKKQPPRQKNSIEEKSQSDTKVLQESLKAKAKDLSPSSKTIEKPIASKSISRSESKTMESASEKKTPTITNKPLVAKNTVPTPVTSIKSSKITMPPTTLTSSNAKVISTTKTSPADALNKTAVKPIISDTKSNKASVANKNVSQSSVSTTLASKNSTVSTILSSNNIPKTSTKPTNKSVKSDNENTKTFSSEKSATVSTMKTSTTKVLSSGSAKKPLSPKPAVSSSIPVSSATKSTTAKSSKISESKTRETSKEGKT